MRTVALAFLAAALWDGSRTPALAQSRMGGQCAGHSAGSSSSLMMNSSPGFSAFGGNGNGSMLNNGSTFGSGMSSTMGGGFGSSLEFATSYGYGYGYGMSGGFSTSPSASAFAPGGYGFDNGFGQGTMIGQNYGQSTRNEDFGSGINESDPDTAALKAAFARSNTMPRTRSRVAKMKSSPKSKATRSKSR